jgi:uncharacterized protein YktB (UPF0637 family)
MKFTGFEQADFDLFLIEGLESRMTALIEQLRPKFYDLGEDLAAELSVIVGEEKFPHVAKHARRKTNPPDDSWVAWGGKRGYKMLPHFQVTVWKSHVLVQWGLIYEAKAKDAFSKNVLNHIHEIRNNIPEDYHFFKNHMKPEGIPLKELSDDDLKEYARRLVEVKKGELMVGKVIPKKEAIAMSPKEFYDIFIETCKNLSYLHKLAQ